MLHQGFRGVANLAHESYNSLHTPIDEISQIAPRPVMIIHAKGDRLIPVTHAYRLAAAAGIEPWIISGNGHVDTYPHEPHAYIERVAAFFNAGLH